MRITVVNDSLIHQAIVEIVHNGNGDAQTAATVTIDPEEGAHFELGRGCSIHVTQGEVAAAPSTAPSNAPSLLPEPATVTVSPTASALNAVVSLLQTHFEGIVVEAEARDYGNLIEVAVLEDSPAEILPLRVMQFLANTFESEVEHIDYAAHQLRDKKIRAVFCIKARDVRRKLMPAPPAAVEEGA